MSLPLESSSVPARPKSARARTREDLAAEVFQVLPAVKRRLRDCVPADINVELERTTWHQVEVLYRLRSIPGAAGATMSDVAKMQGCALSSATALVDRLIVQGLAERRPDPKDRRVIRIAPTSSGEEFLRHFESARRRIALAALAPLNEEEIATVLSLLRKVASGGESDVATDGMEVAHD